MNSEYTELFSEFKGVKHELIPLLQAVQGRFGYLPDESLEVIAEFTGIPASRVYGVATFYAQFRFTPMGRNHVMVCRGTACHIRGAPRLLETLEKDLDVKEGETSEDGEFSLETVACIGACGMAPTMVINDRTYGRLEPKKIPGILKEVREAQSGDSDE